MAAGRDEARGWACNPEHCIITRACVRRRPARQARGGVGRGGSVRVCNALYLATPLTWSLNDLPALKAGAWRCGKAGVSARRVGVQRARPRAPGGRSCAAARALVSGMLISAPVAGLRPLRAERTRCSKVPKLRAERPSQRFPTTSHRRETRRAPAAPLSRRCGRPQRADEQPAGRTARRGRRAGPAATRHANVRPKTSGVQTAALRRFPLRRRGRAPGQRHLLASLDAVLDQVQQPVHHGRHVSLLHPVLLSQLLDGLRLAQRLRSGGARRERAAPAGPGRSVSAPKKQAPKAKCCNAGAPAGRRRRAQRGRVGPEGRRDAQHEATKHEVRKRAKRWPV